MLRLGVCGMRAEVTHSGSAAQVRARRRAVLNRRLRLAPGQSMSISGCLAPFRRGDVALRTPPVSARQNSWFWMSATSQMAIVRSVPNGGYRASSRLTAIAERDDHGVWRAGVGRDIDRGIGTRDSRSIRCGLATNSVTSSMPCITRKRAVAAGGHRAAPHAGQHLPRSAGAVPGQDAGRRPGSRSRAAARALSPRSSQSRPDHRLRGPEYQQMPHVGGVRRTG